MSENVLNKETVIQRLEWRNLVFIILSLTIFLAACADPAANVTKVETSEPTSLTPAGNSEQPEPKGTRLPISSENSKIEFTGSKVTGKNDGGFKQFSGTIDLVNDKAEASAVSVEIDMNSLFTDAVRLTKHLKSSDFFDVEKFPISTFASTKIVANEEKGENSYTVTGDLELRGTKRSITFPAKITIGDSEVAVDAEFAINRKDFGIVYAGRADDLIRDHVVIRLILKSQRKK